MADYTLPWSASTDADSQQTILPTRCPARGRIRLRQRPCRFLCSWQGIVVCRFRRCRGHDRLVRRQ